MACVHRETIDGYEDRIDCAACCSSVEVDECPDDDTTCPYAIAVTNGYAVVRSYYRSVKDYEIPRYENSSVDVTEARYVTEKKPRPNIDPSETFKIFDLEPGDHRRRGAPTDA